MVAVVHETVTDGYSVYIVLAMLLAVVGDVILFMASVLARSRSPSGHVVLHALALDKVVA
eukprot:6195227-Pleurochrysis_carterae.AAC.3